jgi:hypothetical protein
MLIAFIGIILIEAADDHSSGKSITLDVSDSISTIIADTSSVE